MLQLALIGTTASGKTDLAHKIALKTGAVILSLDALCVYKLIDIASAKPSKDELAQVPYFGINLIEPNEYFSVGEFIKEYEKAREFATQSQIPLIITGGSGFYLKSMLSGLAPKIPDAQIFPQNSEIYALASKIDSEFCAKFSAFDTFRLRKWYSIYVATGEIPSEFLRANTAQPVIKNLKIFEILREKDEINERITLRTKKMFEAGILDEAKFLFERYGYECKSLSCVGLKECSQYLRGEISRTSCEELITIHTRQLAKRQRTFNKSQFEGKIHAPSEILEREILEFLSKNG
ncbi:MULTISPECIES: tRNA (adenosine(37)-N6)-dimethylallyltransferase MiaA [unclassified Campylobacter]|uniref:tRNA (adenosine(37)-N6)-dimethylallyltransferase MiaA n=1 Tax=unclassified Campylobacter TaxID=2593542 RepID=UPI0022E9DACB|nr:MULTISPECIES: tRNA (adenosine(37)-N6)-dimethylallyltransferase MiaA [unclassified Campylobacter]MDA3062201.1 tRNA (adenosine(37)-N6)-dimethylallyltransferase MiaA [Campylobacter sp. JMF_14 EL1]MDA3072695.1 tRNA (adenosine(37)-N6)-dimethylallyltransferase MiaA [Campylobacter sp. JMF_10 EL2]